MLLLLVPGVAYAAEFGLSIDPPVTTIKALAPAVATSPFTIKNNGEAQVTLKIQIKPFKPAGENGDLEYFKEIPDFFKDIKILDGNSPTESLTLSPKQQKTLELSVDIPQGTTTSDHYFSVIFISTDTSPIKSNSSINQIGIASNVLLSVGIPETPNSTLEEFSSRLIFDKGPVPFTVRIKNQGAHLIQPRGQIIIKNMFGQIVGSLDLAPVNILSDSIRAIPNDAYLQELSAQKNPDVGFKLLDSRRPIAIWKENFLLGLYTATLNIAISDQGPIFKKDIHFFAFPLRGAIIILIAVILIIITGKRLKFYANKNRT